MLIGKKSMRSTNYRLLGDQARDRRDWSMAQADYMRHLARTPDDAAIWVQLGHAQREQKQQRAAIESYAKAVALVPENADAWLHLGHTLKNIDETKQAITALHRHFELSGSKEIYDLLMELGAENVRVVASPRPAATYLILDDLFKFLADHVTVSGIQRVQVGLVNGLINAGEQNFRFLISSNITRDRGITFFWEVPPSAVNAIAEYAASGHMERDRLDELIRYVHHSAVSVALGSGDTVFVPGAFWIIDRTGLTCASLKAHDVRIGVYVYDLIPVTHPEFCHSALVEYFTRAFTEIVQFADFFLTISQYVADVLEEFLRHYDMPAIPITPLPLAHFLTINDVEQPPEKAFLGTLQGKLKGAKYALYVSTLEGRKNHLYVLSAWQELIRRGVEMPDLIFLGRKGWRSEGLFSFLEGTKYLNGKVHLLHDISDGDLAYLYRHCEFTLFTSYAEGWGLPVGESMVFRKPCIASNACSIPEVAGDFVDYVDPFNLRDGMAVIERMVTDEAYREGRINNIRTSFSAQTWDDVTKQLVSILSQEVKRPLLKDHNSFKVAPNKLCDFRSKMLDLADLRNLLEYPSRILLGHDFYDQEPIGVWMRGNDGIVEIATEFAEGTEAFLMLDLFPAPWAHEVAYLIGHADADSAGVAGAHLMQRGTDALQLSSVSLPVEKDGMVRFRIRVFPESPHVEEGREFYVGIRAFVYSEMERDPASALTDLFITTKQF